jgi:hypothetical protein
MIRFESSRIERGLLIRALQLMMKRAEVNDVPV